MVRKKLISLIVLLITIVVFVNAGFVQGQTGVSTPLPGSSDEVKVLNLTSNESLVSFVNDAVGYVKTNGREKALTEFSNPNGTFVRGELYIYAYYFNGTTLAHPFNPEKIGVNRLNETDAHGGLFIKNLRDMARNESGFVQFYYINPVHNRTIESKLGYVERVDDDWWLGSGIYTGSDDPVTKNGQDLPGQ